MALLPIFPDEGAPRSLPVLGHLLAMRADPLRLITTLAREQGGVARLRIGPFRTYLVTDPDLVGEILVRHHKRYSRKTRVYGTLAEILGQSILTAEGEDWRIHRRIVQPAFHRKRLAAFASKIVAITAAHLEGWRGELDVSDEMMRLTLRIVGEVLIGAETASHAEEIGAAVELSQRHAERVISTGLRIPRSIPVPRNRELNRGLELLDRRVYEIIDEKMRTGKRGDDIVSMLLDSRYEDQSPLPRERIRNELVTLIAAGHETTSNALSWTLMRLSQHPEVARRLAAEVREVIGDREPRFEDVPKLRYARWVFDEALRLHPPVWMTGRSVLEDHSLGGHPLRAGEHVAISPYVTHRRPDLWENPEGFDPDRWGALSERGALPPFAFFPFGGGTRKCVGEAFAYLEAILVLAMIAQRFELHLIGRPVLPVPQITLGFASGLWMRVRPKGA